MSQCQKQWQEDIETTLKFAITEVNSETYPEDALVILDDAFAKIKRTIAKAIKEADNYVDEEPEEEFDDSSLEDIDSLEEYPENNSDIDNLLNI